MVQVCCDKAITSLQNIFMQTNDTNFTDKKLIVAIHDLHPWGGQDKSNLEILYRANQALKMELHTFSFIDPRPWPQVTHIKYSSPLTRPAIFKLIFYSIMSFFRLLKYGSKEKRRHKKTLIQTTGTASPIADIVQVQFIHKTWNNIIKDYNVPETESAFKNLYHELLSSYNILNEERLFTNKKKYIAISHSIKKELIEHFNVHPQNIETIYHGVDLEHFYPYKTDPLALKTRNEIRLKHSIPDDAIVLLHVGALNQRKGIYNSIKTLSFLKKEGVEGVYLLAVGEGDKKELSAMALKEGVGDQFKIASHSKNVRDYYWASDIFFFPSIYEPFGLVILEAMACGLTCAISGNAGATELITNNQNGLILQNIFDPESMGHELNNLIKDSLLRESLGAQALITAQQRPWSQVAKDYLEFYQRHF